MCINPFCWPIKGVPLIHSEVLKLSAEVQTNTRPWIEAAQAVADKATSELELIVRKQEQLKKALKNAGDRLKSAQKESSVALRVRSRGFH